MCGGEQALGTFADPAALFDALHGPGGDPAVRNAILAALVRRAQAGVEAAGTVLLLVLWPGLDAVHRRLLRHFRGEPDVLVSDIAGRVVAGIHGLDLTRVNRVAATLIRNCERDIVRGLHRAWAESRRHITVDDEAVCGSRDGPEFGLPADLGADYAAARLVDLIEPVVGADALLVVTIAVTGERQHTASEMFGLGAEAGRKRYQRALRRLRVALEEIF